MENNYLSQSINYDAQSDNVTVGTNNYSGWGGWWPDYERTIIKEYYPTYWPSYITNTVTVTAPSKLEQAFKIVSKLIEKRIITKKLKVKDFVELVNQVSDIV